jgi:hypothetical protein
MKHPDKTHLQHTSEKTDETLRTGACNTRVQPLQHVQHPNILLQHPYETNCNIPLKHLKHLKQTLTT